MGGRETDYMLLSYFYTLRRDLFLYRRNLVKRSMYNVDLTELSWEQVQ